MIYFIGDNLSFHDGMKFSTPSRDDEYNCSVMSGANWWYNQSFIALLTGLYGEERPVGKGII